MTEIPNQPAQSGWAPPPPPAYGPANHTATNGLAVASLVCGILWIGGLLSVLALIFGIIALSQIRRQGGRGRGMAIAGTILGGLGIVLGMVFVAGAVLFVGRVSEEVEADALATVEIETSSGDVCWKADVISGQRLRSGQASLTQSGCGPTNINLGRGLLRAAEITKTSGTGTLTAVLTIDGSERNRQTTDGAKPLTVTPFDQVPREFLND